MNKRLWYAVGATFIVLSTIVLLLSEETINRVCFEDVCVDVEVADEQEERSVGLMNRTSLPEYEGMLFVFGDERVRHFWMKDTLIPLDMIWADSEGKVVSVNEAVPCRSDPCPTYSPNLPVKYVLEVNRGFSKKHAIERGDLIRFS